MNTALDGCKVLVVEDEYLIASLIEQMLESAGCVVSGPVSRLAEAVEAACNIDCDAALLDINLAGERVFPVADLLSQRGVPFVFLTGYARDTLPAEYAGRPCLCKPFKSSDLFHAIADAVGAAG
jgi:CheY-like chemotaxis protein